MSDPVLYCSKCGSQLVPYEVAPGTYYRHTGQPIIHVRFRCPNRPRRSLSALLAIAVLAVALGCLAVSAACVVAAWRWAL